MHATAQQEDDTSLHGLIDLEHYPINQLDGQAASV